MALAERRAADAVSLAERALVLRTLRRIALELVAEARLRLADALWSAGNDRERAVQLARRARSELLGIGPAGKRNLAEVDAWLKLHGD